MTTAFRYATAIFRRSVRISARLVAPYASAFSIASGVAVDASVPLYPQVNSSFPDPSEVGAPDDEGTSNTPGLTSQTLTLPSEPQLTKALSFRTSTQSHTASVCPTSVAAGTPVPVSKCEYVVLFAGGRCQTRIVASREALYSNLLDAEWASAVIGAVCARSVA